MALLAMIYTVGPISGCHLNPAVTVEMVLTRIFEVKRAPGYIAAQIIGAILAAATLYAIARWTGLRRGRQRLRLQRLRRAVT